MLAFASSVKHSDKLFGSAQVVMMATSNMVLLLLPLLLPAQVCHEPCNALYMLPYSSVSHDDQTLCTSNVAVCTQLMTQLVISHRTCLHPASPSWLSLSCVLPYHCVHLGGLCGMTRVSAKGFLNHVKHVAVRLFTVRLACR